jgi:hypothetical protein
MKNGFTFSSSKPAGIHFSIDDNYIFDQKCFCYNSPIQIAKNIKCLVTIFDSKLAFVPHIEMIQSKWLKHLTFQNLSRASTEVTTTQFY